jgi:hypothetical protein
MLVRGRRGGGGRSEEHAVAAGRAGQQRGAGQPAAARSRVERAARTLEQDPDGLLADEPLLAALVSSPALRAHAASLPDPPSQAFRLLRPRDLVHLEVLAYSCTLTDGEEGPVLVADDEESRLEVRLPFQHVAEQAWYDLRSPTPTSEPGAAPVSVAPGSAETPGAPPSDARAAHGSRLVFAVPEDERIGFTSAGVLAALSRLPLRVPTLATPRAESRRLPPFAHVVAELGGGLVLTHEQQQLVVRAAPAAWLRGDQPADLLVATLRTAHARIAARRILAEAVAVDLSGIAGTFEVDVRRPVPIRRPRRQASEPRPDETAIEAPYRLIVSPSDQGGFAHSPTPVTAPSDEHRVELWHSRLGVRRHTTEGWVVDERPDPQRIVRAVWARDLAFYSDATLRRPEPDPGQPFDPFRTSLDRRDRRILVRQSAETALTVPEPVDVQKLYLSSLGAWLDLHGAWEHHAYSAAGEPAIEAWDHVAPMGRDQFVRVVYPGYLFPFGHRASLVKVTERRIKRRGPNDDPHAPQARLYQRKFIVIGEPSRTFDLRDLPFRDVRLRPPATPDIDDPATDERLAFRGQDIFWPAVGGREFQFTLDTRDHDGRRVRLQAPLLFVASHVGASTAGRADVVTAYAQGERKVVPAAGQWTAFARHTVPGDTSLEVETFTFRGDPEIPGPTESQTTRAVPHLVEAAAVPPAVRHLGPGPTGPVTVMYAPGYVTSGFAAATEVFLQLAQPLPISYGGGTDRAGGFVQPDLQPTQLSRRLGAIGPLQAVGGDFDAKALLEGLTPKLFGLFELWEVLGALGIDELPRFVTEALDEVSALVTDLQRLATTVEEAIARLQADAHQANAAVAEQLDTARGNLEALRGDLTTRVTTVVTTFADVLGPGATSGPEDVIDLLRDTLRDLEDSVTQIRVAITGAPLPPTVRAELERLVDAIGPVLELAELPQRVLGFLRAIDPEGLSVRASYLWQPPMRPWPSSASPVFVPQPDGFTLSVEARASASAGAGVDVLAELRGFSLHLLPGAPMLRMDVERIAFRASSGRKPETDVVFGSIEFLGVLGFIDTLRRLIPFDGFADPPYLDVSADGVTAGFDLGLPNVAVGVFSLENVSLGADCRVPFLGDAVTVGFNFCTRDRPFRLTVMAIGGGGFVAIRLSPQGLVVLEMALEAGASLSVNLGVASGSVSAMVGVYLRLEAAAGSLTGYFRLRGEVNVLGLVSASITLELSLTYEFATGKMVGRASVVVEVSVLFFSASVEISVERRLAGGSGDPTFAQIMDVTGGTSDAWDTYCRAFAAE